MKPSKRVRKSTKRVKGRIGGGFEWEPALDIKARALRLVTSLSMDSILFERVFFYRSTGSKSRAYARTWGLPRLWQNALDVEPAYIIEVISKHFDSLPPREMDKVLLHELSHIPKNFSGALVPHTRRRKGSFHRKLEELISDYFKKFG